MHGAADHWLIHEDFSTPWCFIFTNRYTHPRVLASHCPLKTFRISFLLIEGTQFCYLHTKEKQPQLSIPHVLPYSRGASPALFWQDPPFHNICFYHDKAAELSLQNCTLCVGATTEQRPALGKPPAAALTPS